MSTLLEKLSRATNRIVEQYGRADLLAAYQREEGGPGWRVLVAASGLSPKELVAPQELRDLLRSELGSELRGVKVVDVHDEEIDSIARVTSGQTGIAELRRTEFFGIEMRRLVVLTVRRNQAA